MMINFSVPYNDGLLPDIFLLTLCDKPFDNFPPEGGYSAAYIIQYILRLLSQICKPVFKGLL